MAQILYQLGILRLDHSCLCEEYAVHFCSFIMVPHETMLAVEISSKALKFSLERLEHSPSSLMQARDFPPKLGRDRGRESTPSLSPVFSTVQTG